MKARKQARKEGFYKIRYKAMMAWIGEGGTSFFFFFVSQPVGPQILTRIERTPLAVKAQSPSHSDCKGIPFIFQSFDFGHRVLLLKQVPDAISFHTLKCVKILY